MKKKEQEENDTTKTIEAINHSRYTPDEYVYLPFYYTRH
jgi:hypothetical protein